jgi:hypothetical protein
LATQILSLSHEEDQKRKGFRNQTTKIVTLKKIISNKMMAERRVWQSS